MYVEVDSRQKIPRWPDSELFIDGYFSIPAFQGGHGGGYVIIEHGGEKWKYCFQMRVLKYQKQ